MLLTHPFSREKPAVLERELEIPAGQKTTLKFLAAAHEKGDWELRVFANGQRLHHQTVGGPASHGETWQSFVADLTPFAGKKIKVRLENAANGWSYEFAYWTALEIVSEARTAAR